jgi:hypothetical protein
MTNYVGAMQRSARFLILPLAVGLVLAAAAVRAEAGMLGDASVPFHAQRTVTVDGRSYTGPIYHAPGHQRHEQDMLGLHEVFLLDTKAVRGFLVLPSVHTYVEFPFPPLMAELDSPDLLRAPVGPETVSGVKTTKYRVDHVAGDGSRAQGYLWVTQTGVLMKLDVAVNRAHGGKPMAITMLLSQFEAGPVNPALFVLPEGFVRLPADALGPLLGGQPG